MQESISDLDPVLAARVAAKKTKEGAAAKSDSPTDMNFSGLGNLTKNHSKAATRYTGQVPQLT